MIGERRSVSVIGIGNPDCGDDAAGSEAIKLLRTTILEGVTLEEQTGEATALLSSLERRSAAFLVDACMSGLPPGTILTFDAAAEPLSRHLFATSTHGLGVADAIELARAFGTLPDICTVYAIEGRNFSAGAPLSPEVRTAIERLCRQLQENISHAGYL